VKAELANLKAWVLNAFGTVVDCRCSMIAAASGRGKAKSLNY
jgi:hypothetical protein